MERRRGTAIKATLAPSIEKEKIRDAAHVMARWVKPNCRGNQLCMCIDDNNCGYCNVYSQSKVFNRVCQLCNILCLPWREGNYKALKEEKGTKGGEHRSANDPCVHVDSQFV